MRRLAVVSLLLLGTGIAAASPRFHPLTPSFKSRLQPETQHAIGLVGQVNGASGFVVHADGRGRGLLLTNEHVARGGFVGKDDVRFFDGGAGKVRRVLASDAALDYALLEVDLPVGVRGGLPLSRGAHLTPSRPIYSIAAFANLRFPGYDDAVSGGTRFQDALGNQPNRYALALGKVNAGSSGPGWVQVGPTQVFGVGTTLPNSPGMSGSPVLAADTHHVVGLHSSGNAKPDAWQETTIPMSSILGDVEARARNGAFDPDSHALVGAMLARAH